MSEGDSAAPSLSSNNRNNKNDNRSDLNNNNKGNEPSPDFLVPKEPMDLTSDVKTSTPPLPSANVYCPPDWAIPCPSDAGYNLDVIKNGIPLPDCLIHLSDAPTSASSTHLSFCLVGRQPQPSYAACGDLTGQCVVLAHPSVSRLHAVFQFGKPPASIARTSSVQPDKPGWYIQDFDSTHGTFINKRRLPAGRFVRIHVGHVIRFGGSTRLYLLQGPSEDVESESDLSWTQLKAAHVDRKHQTKMKATLEKRLPESTTNLGCDWGLTVDELNSNGLSNVLQMAGASGACLTHENLYQDDPKRALKTYFEREDIDPPPEYEFADAVGGKQHCKIELPLSTGTVTAEVTVTGKRKEAMAACALEACRLLDRLGEFDPNKDHPVASEYVRRRAKLESNDYYSSDEDTFTDRTGQVERKRLSRIKQLCGDKSLVEQAELEAAAAIAALQPINDSDSRKNFDSKSMLHVLAKLEEVGEEIVQLEGQLERINKEFAPRCANPSELDELETFMNALKGGAPSRKERLKLKSQLFKLRQLEMQLFQRAGLRQPRRIKPDVSDVAPANCAKLRLDAAAAVRAAKHKLTSQACQEGDHFDDRPRNTKFVRDELKRTLPGHKQVASTPIDQSIDVEPFSVEEDEDEEVDQPVENRISSEPTVEPPEEVTFTSDNHLLSPICQPASTNQIDSFPMTDQSSNLQRKSIEVNESLSTESKLQTKNVPFVKQRGNEHNYDTTNPDYITWVPPSDQKGDGFTALNAKYGY